MKKIWPVVLVAAVAAWACDEEAGAGDLDAAVRGDAGPGGDATCAPVPDPAPSVMPAAAFASPQAVAFAGDRLLVTNTVVDPATFQSAGGFVTVIDPAAGAVVNRIPTTQRNPQQIAALGDTVYVVNTGVVDFGDFSGPPVVATAGGVDALSVATLDTASAPTRNTPVQPDPCDHRVGAPVDLVFARGRGYLGLAIANAVLQFDPASGELTRPASDPIRYDSDARVGLGSLATDGDRIYVVDFNVDRLFVLDAGDGSPWGCHVELGVAPDDLEGATAPRVSGGRLYYLLSIAGSLRAVDLAELARPAAGAGGACPGSNAAQVVAPLGQVPNDLRADDGRLLVVHSGDNNVKAWRMDGTELETWSLAVGSNPWSAAVSPDGRWLAVTEYAANAVSLFDLDAGGAPVRLTVE